jgi:hypothetical protein
MSDDSRSVRMRLFGPFRANAASEEQQDIEVTHQVLDVIEREVGTRPCEYMLDIGGDRRWDPRANAWTEIAPPVTTSPITANPG